MLWQNARMITVFGVVSMAGCQLFFFNAVTTVSVGVALLLEYLGIVLVVFWLWARHGHRPRGFTWVGMALSVAGLALILDVTGGADLDVGGVLWGLAAATGLAAYFVMSAHAGRGGLPPIVLSAGGMVVATLTLAAAGIVGLMPVRYDAASTRLAGVSMPWYVPVVGLALVATALAYTAGIAAIRRLGSKVASFVGLTEVLFSVGFAWLLLGQLMRPIQVAGGLLILVGVAAVRYEETRHRPAEPALEPPLTPAPAA